MNYISSESVALELYVCQQIKGTHHTALVVVRVKMFQNKLMVEIDSKSLVKANGVVFFVKFIQNTNQNTY